MNANERLDLIKFAEEYGCNCAHNYPGTTEYHGHDCENDVVQEFVEQWLSRLGGKDDCV